MYAEEKKRMKSLTEEKWDERNTMAFKAMNIKLNNTSVYSESERDLMLQQHMMTNQKSQLVSNKLL